MKKKFFVPALVIGFVIFASFIPAYEKDTQSAFAFDEKKMQSAAEKCVGDICATNESAYILYMYDVALGADTACMYGITEALTVCDHAVMFAGKIGVANKEDLGEKLSGIVSKEVEVTHILTDSYYIYDGVQKYAKDNAKAFKAVYIPSVYANSGL